MDKPTCSEDGCDEPVQARGMCKSHYGKWNYRQSKSGKPLPPAAVRTRATCTIEDCGKPAQARGYCPKHYRRWKLNGDPLIARRYASSVEERVWAAVDKRGPGECWPWTAFVGQRGYGQFPQSRTSSIQAHRIVYQLSVGPIPDDLELDHVCHNRDLSCPGGRTCSHRRCVNPAHLEPVTGEENTRRVWARVAARKAA